MTESLAPSRGGYVPSGNTVELVLESLNDYLSVELALPGNWSPQIFHFDAKTFPAKSKQLLAENLSSMLTQANPSYLTFFKQTRGYDRPSVPEEKDVWRIFNEGSIMMYFEEIFLNMLRELQETQVLSSLNQALLQYMEVLSNSPLNEWDAIVANIGACSYLYFVENPYAYAHLIFCNRTDQPEDMTDFEILDQLSVQLSPAKYPDRISIQDNRTALVTKYKKDKFTTFSSK